MKKRKGALNICERFGLAVRTRRDELGWNQEELAEQAGIHRTYLSDVERGSRNLSLVNIEKLAVALGLSLAELFQRV
ncbi:MAG TPA: helix-turn-helix transcriptional regulator [Pirellulales bacterium]